MQYLTTVSLIPSATPEVIDFIGDPQKAAGFYGPTAGLHTLAMKVSNFTGMIFIDGTLSVKPLETDWFPILLAGKAGLTFADTFSTPFNDWISIGYYGVSTTIGFTFNCNCLFLRARMIRSYTISPYASPQQISTYGQVDYIKVAY